MLVIISHSSILNYEMLGKTLYCSYTHVLVCMPNHARTCFTFQLNFSAYYVYEQLFMHTHVCAYMCVCVSVYVGVGVCNACIAMYATYLRQIDSQVHVQIKISKQVQIHCSFTVGTISLRSIAQSKFIVFALTPQKKQQSLIQCSILDGRTRTL